MEMDRQKTDNSKKDKQNKSIINKKTLNTRQSIQSVYDKVTHFKC